MPDAGAQDTTPSGWDARTRGIGVSGDGACGHQLAGARHRSAVCSSWARSHTRTGTIAAGADRRVQPEYPGEPLSEDEYHAAVEAALEPCACGGAFRYDAPARCPSCRSAEETWALDPDGPTMFID